MSHPLDNLSGPGKQLKTEAPDAAEIAGLLRQYFPKGTDLSGYSQEQLDAVADQLNGRPRMTLGWRKPIEVYAEHLARLTHQPDSFH